MELHLSAMTQLSPSQRQAKAEVGQGHRQNLGHKHKERQKQKLGHSGIATAECPRPVQLEALNGRHLELVNKQSAALIVAD